MSEPEQAKHEEQYEIEPEEAPISRAGIWSFFLLAIVGGIFLVFAFPSNFAPLVLIGLIIVAVLVSALDADVSPKDIWETVRGISRGDAVSLQQMSEYVSKHRNLLIIGGVLSSIVFMILATIQLRPGNPESVLGAGVFWILLGIIGLGVALIAYQQPEAQFILSEEHISPKRSHAITTLFGILFLVLFAEINGKVFNLPFFNGISLDTQFLLLVVGSALLIWGYSGAPSIKRSQFTSINWREHLPIFAIFVFALILNSWKLDTVYGLVDEGLALNHVMIAESTRTESLAEPLNRFSSTLVFSYMQSKLTWIFGRDLGGLRAISAVMGSLTVIALYILAKALFNKKTALIAAFLLATFPPQIHFSRIALANIADPLFGTMALAFIVRGFKYNRRFDWAVAGVFFGLTQYFFEAGRLLYPPLIIIWIVAMIFVLSPKKIANFSRGLVVMALTAFIVGMPVYYTIFARDVPRTARLDVSGLDRTYWQDFVSGGITFEKIGDLSYKLLFPFRVYAHQPEIGRFYDGDTAMILQYLVPFFFLGIAYAFWRGKSPVLLLLLWLIATPLGNGLLRNSAVYVRYPVVFPAITLMIALSLTYVLPILWSRKGHWQRILNTLIIVVTLAMGIYQVNYYFGTHLPEFAQDIPYAKPYRDGLDAMMRTGNFPENTQIIMVSNPVNDQNILRAVLGYVHPPEDKMVMSTISIADLTEDYLRTIPLAEHYAFFLEPEDETSLNLISQFFELGEAQRTSRDIPEDKQYVLYFASGRK